ncbi:MAG: hypothetical protein KJZ47_09725, partial [Gemmatimonadales bacterium]|nr:hypothetical protein [Gemmatimonadales bacterium]
MMMMLRRRHLLGLAALLALPGAAAAQGASMLYVIVGSDTIARERFTRTAGGLTGETLSAALGFRFRFTVAVDGEGIPTRMDNAFWLPTDA